MLAFLFISLIAPTTCSATLARATCVRDEASLPGRGDVAARCAAANVIAEAEEYSTFCDDAAGAPCRCCRRLRRDAEADRADARARDRCRGARAAPTRGLAVYTVERPVSPLFAAFRAADLATFVFPRSLAGEADYVFRYLRRRLGLRDEAHAAALRRRVDAQARSYGARPETAYGKVVLRRHGFAACYFNERWWRELYAGRYFGHAGPTSHLGANWKGRGGPGRRAR
ncbi:hypothetical protein JL722_9019 [Aureococcus anophagefferens]|nr:hypothetical protein JL722_9019 [Aureococcus anophagefferens]